MLYPFVCSIGLGCLFQVGVAIRVILPVYPSSLQAPLIGLQAAMPLKDMATSTSTFGLLRYGPSSSSQVGVRMALTLLEQNSGGYRWYLRWAGYTFKCTLLDTHAYFLCLDYKSPDHSKENCQDPGCRP